MENTHNAAIPCFSISALTDLARTPDTAPRLFSQELIARCDSEEQWFRFPCRIDAFIVSLCTRGEGCARINLSECDLHPGSLLVCGPKVILERETQVPARHDILIVSPALLSRVRIDIRNTIPQFIRMGGSSPALRLTEGECASLHTLIAMIEAETRATEETTFTTETIYALLSAAIHKTCDIMARHTEHAAAPDKEKEGPHNRAEEYFRQFMQLLGEHYTRERSVGFYARQMCITPKYLTTLIKRVSGKSVSEWIDSYVILEAKTLLKYSSKSIQEIAYRLNFPNQSFYGSYFKRIAAMSPTQYKAQ